MMAVQQQQAGGNQNVTPFHSASLYVGDLAPDISESTLFEIFNQVGPVASIRVCRDTVTRRSLGYAYVNFHNVADAERALDTMNFSLIKQKPCRIMWSQRDPSLRRSGVGNIFVKNLDTSVDNKALYDTFSLFGNILSCKVATDEMGESKGYGYVHYETEEAAKEAIAKIDGMLIANKQVHVGHFVRRNERAGQADWTNIYVKNIPQSWTEEILKREFTKFGTITSAKIQVEQNEEGASSKGFGFINFEDHSAAQAAVEAMNGRLTTDTGLAPEGEAATEGSEARALVCCRAQKKSERQRELQQKYEQLKLERMTKYQGVNLYIKNLDENVTEDQMRDAFAPYGTITSARIMKDPQTGNSRGFGFICFSSPEEATKAVQEMNGKMVGGKPIYVALAQRKEVRRAQLEAQYSQRAGIPGPRGGPMGALQPGMYGMPYMMAGQPMGPQQPRAGAYPMMPQMMPRGAPRGPMQPYPGRGTYQMPAYAAMGQMAGQPQQRRPGTRQRPPVAGAMPGTGGAVPAGAPGMAGNRTAAQPQQQRGGIGAQQGGGARAGGANNFKYTQQVRNQPQMGAAGMPGPAETLTAQALAAAAPEVQKNMIGERLYPLISEVQPELAGKITGMLLEMDNGELLHLLESPDSLKAKISEALQVLEQHVASES